MLTTISSPHSHKKGQTTSRLMATLLLATLPGTFALSLFFGYGVLLNILLATLTALACEAAILKLRKRPVMFFLKDLSAVVTAVLLALALPPGSPWWLIVLGTAFAIIIAKQLYGGLGMNPFNPAMIAYVVLLISFPIQMTSWIDPSQATPTLSESFDLFSAKAPAENVTVSVVDAFSGATPLDSVKTYAANPEKLAEIKVLNGMIAGVGWEWVNIGFLLGGLLLLFTRVITWHIPLSFILALGLSAAVHALFSDGLLSQSILSASLFHLLSGGAMLGAFFIATDPVSAATSNRGKLIYGAAIGLLVYIIRIWGGYPDAIAFAVLLLNLAAPTIDHYTQPKAYGHQKAKRGIAK